MANVVFKQMLAGQAELDRKKAELKQLVGFLSSVLQQYPPLEDSRQTILGLLAQEIGEASIRPFPGKIMEKTAEIVVLVHPKDKIVFNVRRSGTGGGLMMSFVSEMNDFDTVSWLYEEADGFIEAALDYLRNPRVITGASGERELMRKIEEFKRQAPQAP